MKKSLEAVLKENQTIGKIWRTLSEHGQTVWVGGGVRDFLLGLPAHDFDLATSLRPEEILRIAAVEGWAADHVGISFGVVVIHNSKTTVEVATFRKEGYGEDPHRPSWVEYSDCLEEDLARRDFTINGMALTLQGELIDCFCGQEDLKARKIRAIGNPAERFQEDALRMLRGVRFASQLNFQIEKETGKEIFRKKEMIQRLSQERITEELEKIWQSKWPEIGWKLLDDLGLGEVLYLRLWPGKNQTNKWQNLSTDLATRWAFVGWNLSPQAIACKGINSKIQKEAVWLITEAETQWQGMATLQKWRKTSPYSKPETFRDGVRKLLRFQKSIHDADFKIPAMEEVDKELRMPFFQEELAINGDNILEFIPAGPKVGEILGDILIQIQEKNLLNQKEELLEYVKDHWKILTN